MTVKSVYVAEVDLTSPDDSVQVAARRMHDRKVGSLVVSNESNRPIGIVTDRDLAMRVVATGRDPNITMVGEVMTREPRCVSQNAKIEDAISTMRAASCRRLPVVDDQERLVGVVTLDDILELLSEEFRDIGTLLWSENPNSLSPVR